MRRNNGRNLTASLLEGKTEDKFGNECRKSTDNTFSTIEPAKRKEQHREAEETLLESKTVGDSVAFDFSDTGVGMSKETLGKLWSPLFTTKAKGMGFGLPICRRLVEAHESGISAESRFGSGIKFTITIPIEPKVNGGEKVWVNIPESLSSTTTKAYGKH